MFYAVNVTNTATVTTIVYQSDDYYINYLWKDVVEDITG